MNSLLRGLKAWRYAWMSGPSADPPVATFELAADKDLLEGLSDDELHLLEERAETGSDNSVLCLALNIRADRRLLVGDVGAAIPLLHRSIALNPEQPAVRLQLAGLTASTMPPSDLVELLLPALDLMLAETSVYALHISWLVVAAAKERRADPILATLDVLGENEVRWRILTPDAFALVQRQAWLRTLTAVTPAILAAAGTAYNALHAATELAMCAGIEALEPDEYEDIGSLAIVLAAICRRSLWNRAYRQAIALVTSCLTAGELADFDKHWHAAQLPPEAIALLYRRKSAQANSSIATPKSWTDVQSYWASVIAAGDSAAMLHFVPLLADETDAAQSVEHVLDGPLEIAPLWIFMTWRDHASRLLSHLANLRGPNGRIIVSVGGDGRPADLRQALAAMLVPAIFFLRRAPTSWGGPKLLFQTVLETMEVFRQHAGADAWLQVVCDRTFPIISPTVLSARLRDRAELARFRYLRPLPCWESELTPNQIDTLPDLLQSSFDDVFRSIDSRQLEAIAGHWPIIDDVDYRLRSASFNFSNRPQTLGDTPRLGGQTYAISASDVDFKWMSFTRLHQFVDTVAENGTTYTRQLDPFAKRWIHQVLKNMRLRNGDPFALSSHAYVERILSDSRLPEIVSAMQVGFGPEMNFFDTMAASLDLEEDFLHIYKRTLEEAPTMKVAPELFRGADIEGCAFFRKTESIHGRSLQRLFADRVRDVQDWKQVFWIARGPTPVSLEAIRPALDPDLIAALLTCKIEIRDMLDRSRHKAHFSPNGILCSADGEIDARWTLTADGVKIDYRHSVHGIKTYSALASDGKFLLLAPDEIVSAGNWWGLFLAIELSELSAAIDARTPAQIEFAYSEKVDWFGGPDAETALLSAFAYGDEASELPCLTGTGSIDVFRVGNAKCYALGEIDGRPVMLEYLGFGHAAGRTMTVFQKANAEGVADWLAASTAKPPMVFHRSNIPGRWCLEMFEGSRQLILNASGHICDPDGRHSGYWIWRSFGLQLFGLKDVSFAVLDQFRFHRGSWRLSGIGEARIGRPITIALGQEQPQN